MRKSDEWRTEDGLTKIQGWARDGLIEKQIAHNMGVAYATLREWKKAFPEIGEALRKGKEVVDREVENALFKSAIGFMIMLLLVLQLIFQQMLYKHILLFHLLHILHIYHFHYSRFHL